MKKIPESRGEEDEMAKDTKMARDAQTTADPSKMSPAQEKMLKVDMARANEKINESLSIGLPDARQSAAQPPQ